MKKIRLKAKKKLKIQTKICITILLIIIFICYFLNFAGKKIFPVLLQQAEIDCKKMAIVVIKNSITDDVLNVLSEDELFNVIQKKDGEVQTIDFNPIIVNKFLTKMTNIVSDNLKKIETGKIDNISFINSEDYNIEKLKNGVISEVPLVIITNNVLLSNIGPKVPVKLNLVGNVISSIETKVSNYGINSALIEIYAKIEVTEEVIIPFQTKRIKVQNNVPVTIKVIQGNVPNYYNSGSLTKSSDIISLPIETDN